MAQPPSDRAWGSLKESGPHLNFVLQHISSTAFARFGTALLKASGFQVLDSAGTGALKKACEGKPAAASIALAPKESKNPNIVTGPSKFGRRGKHSMGFNAYNSLRDGSGTLSVYFPFTAGSKPSASTPIRTTLAKTPLWQLPTRMHMTFNGGEEVETRLEWLDDVGTARDFKAVTWLTQDRFLSLKTDMTKSDWVATTLSGVLLNAVKFRLNAPFEGSGALHWPDYPEVVTPWTAGSVYTYFTPQLPIFSSSKTQWNQRGLAHVNALQAPTFDPSVTVDYLWVHPKFENQPRNFLEKLPNGFDDLHKCNTPTLLGFLYSLVVPKEILLARTRQISQQTWISAVMNIKVPTATAPENINGTPQWKSEQDAIAFKVVAARNLTDNGDISIAAGVKQNFNIVGLDKVMWVEASGLPSTQAALNWRFTGGLLQVAIEGLAQRVGMFFETSVPGMDNFKLQFGVRWGQNEQKQYGAGISAQL